METKTLHFRIGADFGKLLMDIAMEHLIYHNNPVQALKTITESLGGCDVKTAVEILAGNIVLCVDEEEQTVIPVEREDFHDKIFPKIDPMDWMKKRHLEMETHGDNLMTALAELQVQIKRNNMRFPIEFNYESVFKYISGNKEDVLDELEYEIEMSGMGSLFEITKKFIEFSMSVQSTMKWIANNFTGVDREEYDEIKEDCSYTLSDIMSKLQKTVNLDFPMESIQNDSVQNYIESAREIDVVLNKGIEPVDIQDNYTAGWLSPEGDYYALNGEIANMLHNQIGDTLQEKGIVPMYDSDVEKEIDIKTNPDSWLEQAGWVKIHGNWILYGGMFNHKINKENVPMTDTQKKMIGDYIENCHACEIKLGFKKERFSSGMFRAMDKIALHKHFDF